MEAHSLCTLLPSLEHTVFIGDPQQLRPETNLQMLSLESTIGRQYRLDESLLERLMLPQDMSASRLPASHLSIQRRMHPQIADITRLTYPYLKDHESTYGRSPVYGLAQRMFWWDHRVPELESDDLKSHVNLHEVEMVGSLVEYLLRRGAYKQAEIAVLTPYAGQLLELYKRLEVTCDVWLSDKDREALLEEEVLALGEEGRTTKDEIPMSSMLRIATVDNFQGQEAKVIILSTVRSGGKAGFLKTLNRINVACSRARNGELFQCQEFFSRFERWCRCSVDID
jgi:superfamily I DNA and/or RNA helicase